ncbi:hypothetical protein [Methylobacterium durans]|uniref:Uncharacterized protein n=1 Tax=Methylobacterium durans TaxID=2202825 RepID=A0A2U8WBU8_9HYPH|nr:hypothetical protein [Methylobacterium durans]AWN43644.1 hypothetical protein DK389_27960 [Methylobacterium durans]
MDQDTPASDRVARTIAENVYAAYSRQMTGATHPQTEQTMLARLVEAIRPRVDRAEPDEVIEAANAVLAAWEQQDPGVRGPRIASVDLAGGAVGLRPA